jgi:integrase
LSRKRSAEQSRRYDKRKRCNCDGRWQARYPDPRDDRQGGLKRKVERSFPTKREAEAWLVSQQADMYAGTYVAPREAERPFREIIEAWRESWGGRLSPTTAARYKSIVENYLLPEFGSTPIGRIDHGAVQRYVDRLAADPSLAAGTVRNVFAVLRNAMSKGVRRGLVKVNPCTNIDLPRSPREEMLFLDASEIRALAEAIDPYYRTLVYVAAYCGLRSGELLGLRRSDVDLLRGVIHVRRALKDVDGRLEFGETKTHANRTVSLPRFLREMLGDHLASPLPGGNGPDALVFPSKTGKPLRHNLFYRRHFRRAVLRALPTEKAGLRFHDLRHSCASLSIAAGAHVKLVSARLGHSSVQITLDRYAHLYPSVEESLGEALDATFRAAEMPLALAVSALDAKRGRG